LPESTARSRAGSSPLLRAVGFLALAAAIVNITIGGSIFELAGQLAATLGPVAPFAYVLGALLFIPIVLCIAAAGSRITATGGPYGYVDAAFGRFPGFVVAGIFWISNVASSGGIAAVLTDQLSHLLPWLAQPLPRALFLLAVYGALALLNARGIRVGAAVIVAFAAAKVLPLLLLGFVGLHYVHAENLHIVAPPTLAAIGSSLVMVIYAYSGIEVALAPSGEVRDPAQVVPKAALAGVLVVIALYITMQVVTQGVLGAALAGSITPLPAIADAIFHGGGAVLVLVATLSLVGYLHGDLLASSRLVYAMAANGFLPPALAAVTEKYRVPARAVLAHALVAWCLASTSSFRVLALLSGGTICMVYVGCCAAAWKLQRTDMSDTDKPLRLPGGPLIPLLGIAGLTLVLATLGRAQWLAFGAAALAVCALYALTRWLRRQ
jgi:basic amino acid/polyamine antiporter, APA family